MKNLLKFYTMSTYNSFLHNVLSRRFLRPSSGLLPLRSVSLFARPNMISSSVIGYQDFSQQCTRQKFAQISMISSSRSIATTTWIRNNNSRNNNESSDLIKYESEMIANMEDEEYEDNDLSVPDDDEIWNVSPTLPVRSMTFGPFANESEVIQKLVHLGVELYRWERLRGIPDYILKSDFQKDIAPRIRFLCDLGVNPDRLGSIITKNPYLLKENMDSLKTRVEYLQSKKFTPEMIATIVERNPYWLTFKTQDIDKRLGFFQGYFDLTGSEVRELATTGPRLITSHLGHVKDVAFTVKERMGFEPEEIKAILLARPDLFQNFHQEVLWRKFDYLHNEKKFSHERLVKWPGLLAMRESELKSRIGFLEKVGRAQFNPSKPSFVSLRDILELDDGKFATQVAHSSTLQYNEYLKTL